MACHFRVNIRTFLRKIEEMWDTEFYKKKDRSSYEFVPIYIHRPERPGKPYQYQLYKSTYMTFLVTNRNRINCMIITPEIVIDFIEHYIQKFVFQRYRERFNPDFALTFQNDIDYFLLNLTLPDVVVYIEIVNISINVMLY